MRFPRRMPVYDTERGMELLRTLAERRGVSGAAVIRQLVREEAARVGLPLPTDAEETPEEATASPSRRILRQQLRESAEALQEYYTTDPEARELADFVGEILDE